MGVHLNKLMNSSKIKYIMSILISALIFVGMFVYSIYFIPSLITSIEKNGFTLNTMIIPIIIYSIGIICIMCLKKVRIEERQKAEHDEYGNSKKTYASLSAQERKQIDMFTIAEEQSILPDKEYRAMTHEGSKDPDKDLENLIGLNDVKIRIDELKATMEYTKKEERHAFHSCFLGNPGTGKTTIAKILTGFLYKYQFIKKNEFVCTDASSILASSNPVRKIQLILRKSHGKVIFIDEAYAFAFDNTGKASEALAILINEMENSRENTTIIFAGYKKEMRYLFQLNSGLKSRINTYLFFEDYDQNELTSILHTMLKQKNMTISDVAQNKAIKIILWQKCLPDFANARTVRTLVENAISKHYYNLSKKLIPEELKNEIQEIDIVEQDKVDDYFHNY